MTSIIFGRVVAEKVYWQIVLGYFTSPN